MLSGTGRKYLRGPRGTGFLYVRKAMLEKMDPPFLDDHASDLDRNLCCERWCHAFRNVGSYLAGRIGLGVAVDYALDLGMEAISSRVRMLAMRLRDELAELPGVSVHDQGAEQCGIVTFSIVGNGGCRNQE